MERSDACGRDRAQCRDLPVQMDTPHEGHGIRTVNDVLRRLIIAPGDSAHLTARTFDPVALDPLEFVILATEGNGDVTLRTDQLAKPDGSVEIFAAVEGPPGTFVILDALTAAEGATQAGGAAVDAFASPRGPLQLSCNVKPANPGVAGNLKQTPGTVVPGEGPSPTPDDPSPPSGGGGGPCSSTADDNTCDTNSCLVIPPSGTVTLSATAVPIPEGQREIAVAALLRDGAALLPTNLILQDRDSGRIIDRKILTTEPFIVKDGRYLLRIPVPDETGSADHFEILVPVETSARRITQLTLSAPSRNDVLSRTPLLLGDVEMGEAVRLLRSFHLPDTIVAETRARDIGWLLVCLPAGAELSGISARTAGSAEQTATGEPEHVQFRVGDQVCLTAVVPSGQSILRFDVDRH